MPPMFPTSAQAEEAVKSAIAAFGPPDIVVASAGISEPGYFTGLLVGQFRAGDGGQLFRYALRRSRRASVYARAQAWPDRSHFIRSGLDGRIRLRLIRAVKFAVRGFAETLRAELRADNIAVLIAYPPDTETPMLEEERKTAPAETQMICSLAKTWSADAVADCILHGVRRGAFAITPGLPF